MSIFEIVTFWAYRDGHEHVYGDGWDWQLDEICERQRHSDQWMNVSSFFRWITYYKKKYSEGLYFLKKETRTILTSMKPMARRESFQSGVLCSDIVLAWHDYDLPSYTMQNVGMLLHLIGHTVCSMKWAWTGRNDLIGRAHERMRTWHVDTCVNEWEVLNTDRKTEKMKKKKQSYIDTFSMVEIKIIVYYT